MEVEFMTADTTLPPCMPLPRAMLRLPISSTAKVMYARMLDIVFLSGIEDANGILFIHFPIVPFPHRGTGGGTCPQHHDREAFPE